MDIVILLQELKDHFDELFTEDGHIDLKVFHNVDNDLLQRCFNVIDSEKYGNINRTIIGNVSYEMLRRFPNNHQALAACILTINYQNIYSFEINRDLFLLVRLSLKDNFNTFKKYIKEADPMILECMKWYFKIKIT